MVRIIDVVLASFVSMSLPPLVLGTRVPRSFLTVTAVNTCHGSVGYDSDGDYCPCTWHPVAIEERDSHMWSCRAWPGPICGACWAASCECGYVFESVEDAHSRWPNGRLRCAGCAQ